MMQQSLFFILYIKFKVINNIIITYIIIIIFIIIGIKIKLFFKGGTGRRAKRAEKILALTPQKVWFGPPPPFQP